MTEASTTEGSRFPALSLLHELTGYLQRTGLEDLDELDVALSPLIERHGDVLEVWSAVAWPTACLSDITAGLAHESDRSLGQASRRLVNDNRHVNDRFSLALSAWGVLVSAVLATDALRAYLTDGESAWFATCTCLLLASTVWQLVRDIRRRRRAQSETS